MTIPADARRQVIQRAKDRCEYCGLSQAGQEALFHVDHIVPVAALSMNRPLALAIRREETIRGRHPPSSAR